MGDFETPTLELTTLRSASELHVLNIFATAGFEPTSPATLVGYSLPPVISSKRSSEFGALRGIRTLKFCLEGRRVTIDTSNA